MNAVFVNYFRSPTRSTPLNLALARIVLGGYLIWKTIWYDWPLRLTVPFEGVSRYAWAVPNGYPELLIMEKWLLIATLLVFMTGYRLGISSFVSGLLLAHLGTVRFVVNTSGGTTALFFASIVVLLFGLYRDEDLLSIDGFRRTRKIPLADLVDRLKSDEGRTYRMSALKWGLALLAIVYFGGGMAKVFEAGVRWTNPENLSRIILIWHHFYDIPLDFGAVIVEFPLLVAAAAWGTLALELGFLVAMLIGITITPFMLGILGMQAAIAVLIGPFFFDVFLLFSLFLAWDAAQHRLATTRSLDVVFDEHCFLCARSLYPLKFLDIRGTVSFRTPSDVPEEYLLRDEIDFDRSMYAFCDDGIYEGYDAFRALFRQFPVTMPVAWFMQLPIVKPIGKRIYRHVAENRSRYFACRVDFD